MIYLRGHLARPLDAIFSAASRLAVVRVLRGKGEGLSGRSIARLANINHQSAALALQALARLGMVERRERGRTVLWRLDRRRWLVSELIQPLLDGEARHAEEVSAAIKRRFSGICRSVLLTGPAAQGRLEPGKPVSLIIVESAGRRGVDQAVRLLRTELSERWALGLEARVVSAREAGRLAALEAAWRLLPDEGPGFLLQSVRAGFAFQA